MQAYWASQNSNGGYARAEYERVADNEDYYNYYFVTQRCPQPGGSCTTDTSSVYTQLDTIDDQDDCDVVNGDDCFETVQRFVSYASLSPGGTVSVTARVRSCKNGGVCSSYVPDTVSYAKPGAPTPTPTPTNTPTPTPTPTPRPTNTPTPTPTNTPTPTPTPTPLPLDYDKDDDGLIEITNLAQLNAVRWDLDGDGSPVSAHSASYRAVFPRPKTNMGCPSAGCKGYELRANLNFDTNGNGKADVGDRYWNRGDGFVPIGDPNNPYTAKFDGNNDADPSGDGGPFRIRNLYVNMLSGDRAYGGLFAHAGSTAKLHNVALDNADVTIRVHQGPGAPSAAPKSPSLAGGVVGENYGAVADSWVTGRVEARHG